MTSGELLNEARRIGDQLLAAMVATDSGEYVWYQAPPDGSETRSDRLKPYLYDGYLGVAILYAALWAIDGRPRDREIVLRTIARLRSQLAQIVADPQRFRDTAFSVGAMVGLGGYVYGFLLLARLLGEPRLAEEASATASLLDAERIERDRVLDVSHGTAGALLALLALEHVTGSREDPACVMTQARACGEHLLSRRTTSGGRHAAAWPFIRGETPLCGIAHGAAGTAYALLRLYERTREPALHSAALEAFDFERAHYVSEHSNWLDLRNPNRNTFWRGWCNGAPGIALARAKSRPLLNSADRSVATDDVRRALDVTRDPSLGSIDHPCCGNLGRADILIDLAAAEEAPWLFDAARDLASKTIERARRDGGYRWSPSGPSAVPQPALMVGAAGGAYTLLRIAAPATLPSILAFELEPVELQT